MALMQKVSSGAGWTRAVVEMTKRRCLQDRACGSDFLLQEVSGRAETHTKPGNGLRTVDTAEVWRRSLSKTNRHGAELIMVARARERSPEAASGEGLAIRCQAVTSRLSRLGCGCVDQPGRLRRRSEQRAA